MSETNSDRSGLTLYHVVGDRWKPGQPLLSFKHQMEQGLVVYEHGYINIDVISANYTLTDAILYWLAHPHPKKLPCRIVAIDADGLEIEDGEYGHPFLKSPIAATRLRICIGEG